MSDFFMQLGHIRGGVFVKDLQTGGWRLLSLCYKQWGTFYISKLFLKFRIFNEEEQ